MQLVELSDAMKATDIVGWAERQVFDLDFEAYCAERNGVPFSPVEEAAAKQLREAAAELALLAEVVEEAAARLS